MKFGYTFNQQTKEKTGELTALRYSAFDTWMKSPHAYRERYYGGASFVTPETIFGNEMHKIMEKESTYKAHPILSQLPRYSKSEKEIIIDIGGVKIGGRIDSFDPKDLKFVDYKFGHRNKDGKPPWDAVKVAKHRQLVFYSILIESKYGKVARHSNLVWIETRWKEPMMFHNVMLNSQSKELELTGEFKVFKRMITKWEKEKMIEDIIRVAHEINEDFQKQSGARARTIIT